jgi:hypothetical protein
MARPRGSRQAAAWRKNKPSLGDGRRTKAASATHSFTQIKDAADGSAGLAGTIESLPMLGIAMD